MGIFGQAMGPTVRKLRVPGGDTAAHKVLRKVLIAMARSSESKE